MLQVKQKPASRDPHFAELPKQRMAVTYTQGAPRTSANRVLPALYGAVYVVRAQLKMKGEPFKVGPLHARWPDAHLVPKERWTAIWGLAIPECVTLLPQKKPGVQVAPEVWEYGTVAEVVHVGSYAREGQTVKLLHQFIGDSGYEIVGPHEEVYLTTRRARVQRTLIRYAVRPKGSAA